MTSKLCLSLALATLFATPVCAAMPQETLKYTITREGSPVGSHVISFHETAEGIQVDIKTQVAVKMAMITVYHFDHKGAELWQDGKLVSITSTTDDDGDHHQISGQLTGNALALTADGKSAQVEAGIIPASLWNPALVKQTKLLNTLDGNPMAVKIADAGEDQILVRGARKHAHHYVMTGELARELWYDDAGTLVQVKFKADDDSNIAYQLQ